LFDGNTAESGDDFFNNERETRSTKKIKPAEAGLYMT
jgi:hypothetical protein